MLLWIRTAFRGNGSTYRWVCIASGVCALAGANAVTIFLAASDTSSVPAGSDINRYAKDLVAADGLASFAIVMTIVSLVSAAMVIHALVGSVANARRDALAVYRILGATPRRTGMIFLLECAVFTAIGAAIGAGIGTLLAPPTRVVLAYYDLAPQTISVGPRISAVVLVIVLVVIAAMAGSRSGYRDVMTHADENKQQRARRRRSIRLAPLAMAAVFLAGAAALAAFVPPSESAINSVPFGVALLGVIGAALLTPAVTYTFAAITTAISHGAMVPDRLSSYLRIGGRWSATGASRSARIAIPITLAITVVAVIFSLAQTGRSASEYDKLKSVAAESVLDTSAHPDRDWNVSATAAPHSVGVRGDSRWTAPGQRPTVISLFRITHPENLATIFPGISPAAPLALTTESGQDQGRLRVLSGDPNDTVGDTHRWISPDKQEMTVLVVAKVSENRYLRYRYLVIDETFPGSPDTPGYVFYPTPASGAAVPTGQWIEDQLKDNQRTQTAGITAIVVIPILLCAIALLGVVMNIRRELLPGHRTLQQLGLTRSDTAAVFAIISATSIAGALVTAALPLILTTYCEHRIVHGIGYNIPIAIPAAPVAATAVSLSLIALASMAVDWRTPEGRSRHTHTPVPASAD
jgi:putative ABC transport system permease protein